MLGAAPWLGRFCLRWPGLVVFAVVIGLSALLSTLVGPQSHAQSPAWGGTVEVSNVSDAEFGHSSITLNLKPGETKTYYLRLTAQPVILDRDGKLCDPNSVPPPSPSDKCNDRPWWVMIRVDAWSASTAITRRGYEREDKGFQVGALGRLGVQSAQLEPVARGQHKGPG